MLSAGTRTFSNVISACPCGASSYPKTCIMRLMVTPLVSIGTRIIDWRWCVGASGLLWPMKIEILQRGSPAPEIHHLWPLIT